MKEFSDSALALSQALSALTIDKMPTELPYAADAEVSLSYDELDVYRLSPPT